MIHDTGVAARYARALFIVTEKRGETAQAMVDLRSAWEAMRPGTPAGRLLGTPLVLLSDKRRVVQEVLAAKALRAVAVFIDLLLRKKRLNELATIVSEFDALVERQQGIQRAQVVSAVPLNVLEEQQLHQTISNYLIRQQKPGAKVMVNLRLAFDVDSRLLGGALVRIGDRVIDRSVRSLLDAVEQKLLETSV